MSLGFDLWVTAAGLIGLTWLIRNRATSRVIRKRRILSSHSYDAPPADPPLLSVIVAAKDEEAHIASCVTSLLSQDYPNFEIIVVDDRSRDRTPIILRELEAKAASRLRVVTVTTLCEGWFGKNNAMREGASTSRGDWLLFTDADCRQQSPRSLSMAMREALAHEADFLCITPILEAPTVWERIIQPVCALTLMLWFLPHRVNKPHRKTAYANGAFMLLRRSCYDAIGGHDRVRNEVNEDVQMARLTKGMGLRLRVVETDDLYVTRMYDRFASAWRGWSRIFYGCIQSTGKLLISASMLLFLSIAPWCCLAIAIAGWASSEVGAAGRWTWAVLAWSAVVVIEQVMMWRVYRLIWVKPIWSLAHAAGSVVVLGMLFSAMLKAIGLTGLTWRGTTYHGQRLAPDSTLLAKR